MQEQEIRSFLEQRTGTLHPFAVPAVVLVAQHDEVAGTAADRLLEVLDDTQRHFVSEHMQARRIHRTLLATERAFDEFHCAIS